MEKLFVKISDLEFKTKDSDKPPGYFKGYGATFGNKDLGDDIILPGAFDKTIEEHTKAATMPAMFYEHNRNEPIGDYISMSVDNKGLLLEGVLWISSNISRADQAYKMLQSKTAKGLSIGYSHIEPPIYDEKQRVRKLVALRLAEISPTSMPMNPKAKITTIKSLLTERNIISVRDAEDYLRDVANLSAQESKMFISAFKAGIDKERDALALQDKAFEDILSKIHSFKNNVG